jgi:hypothetical protein
MKEEEQTLSKKEIWIERNNWHKGSLFKAKVQRAVFVR